MSYIKKRRALLFFVPLLALLASCKTTPALPDPLREETGSIPLEPGALVYLLADVPAARPILDLLPIQELNTKASKQMLDRTRSAAAALYPPESGRRFQLTGWGSYPALRAGMAFGVSKDWKKQRSAGGLPYWYAQRSGLSIALNSGQAFAAASSDGAPVEPFSASGVEAPEGFGEFRRGAVLSCWLENPGPMLNRVFGQMNIPLQVPSDRIFISLFPVPGGDGQYQGLIQICSPSPTQARTLAVHFSLAMVSIARAAEEGPEGPAALLFANPPVQDGQNLNIKTAVLTEKDIALLFGLFSIYFG
jgi:hypothetical protein